MKKGVSDKIIGLLNKKYRFYFLIYDDPEYRKMIEAVAEEYDEPNRFFMERITKLTKDYVTRLLKENRVYVVSKYIDYNFDESVCYDDYVKHLKSIEQFVLNNKIMLDEQDYLKLFENESFKEIIWYMYYNEEGSFSNGCYSFDEEFINAIINSYRKYQKIKPGYEAIEKDNSINDYITYINEIKMYPLLSAEEERKLLVRAKNGDVFARNFFIKSNLRLVINIARKFIANGVYLELKDLIQEGSIALMIAYDKFDLKKDNKFSTYAYYWILQRLSNYVAAFGTSIYYPKNFTDELRSITMFVTNYIKRFNNEPTDEEISENTGLTLNRIKFIRKYRYKFLSLDNFVFPDDDETFKEFISDDIDIEEEYVKTELVENVRALVKQVEENSQKKDILVHRYGMYDGEIKTFAEIGKKYGFSRQRIDQIEKALLNELREMDDIEHFANYMDYEEEAIKRMHLLNKSYVKRKEGKNNRINNRVKEKQRSKSKD